MREILFRGKTLDGRWVEGSYGHSTIIGEDTYVAAVIYSNDTNLFTADWDEVIPETVGQYIGLTDNNGKKIFEGDIINIEYFETVVENAVIEYVGTSFYGSTDYDDWELDGYCQLEIIGNIHDNPELLNN